MIGCQGAADAVHERALASAVRPDDARPAARERERDVVERRLVGAFVGMGKMMGGNEHGDLRLRGARVALLSVRRCR